ncbi:MAG: hypothetical protein B6D57_02380 [Candidatus Coatesbacteria bacterium 4484_99]|uniref:M23ase beta-sheet core domain-containing protein n=1 Tax=Candidatus Coatesbacteria bacterium 4484_99 TaxID=1970774 RepID=A0A1W9S1V1_9BACT|nr:MAG: hypothetical protein B6D57_02380 [Candidatus Coatesbacteria bacterium 4484_99]
MIFHLKRVSILLSIFFFFLVLFLLFSHLNVLSYSDNTPPSIYMQFPKESEIVSGSICVKFTVIDKESRIESVLIRIDGELCDILAGDFKKKKALEYDLKLDTTKLSEGRHILTVSASSCNGNATTTKDTLFYVDNHPLNVEVILGGSNRVYPGSVLPLQCVLSEEVRDIRVEIMGYDIFLFTTDIGYEGFVPIRLAVEPEEVDMEVSLTDNLGESVNINKKILILPKGFESEYIVLPETKAEPIPKEVIEKEYQILLNELLSPSEVLYEKDGFIIPVEGKITSPYGTYRRFSNGVVSRHIGVDYSCPEGTEVKACGAGVVRLVDDFAIRGKFVLIDHGWGVYSLYNHLSDVLVDVGDIVSKGDVIGKVGSTGLATGPHLHWEVRVGRWAVDPLQWTDERIFANLR